MTSHTPGTVVRVAAPFDNDLPDSYTVESVVAAEDGQLVVLLAGVESAFAPEYLEVAA